ncbi:MAG: type II toxin-antitoxin system death-on-curing family toxin [Sphingomonadaceae bacterium]
MTERVEPRWIRDDVVVAIHDRQLAEHGGPVGIRDAGALESALRRPVNQWAYGTDDRFALAAAYAFGIARNHPFADGNKRTAWILARQFLRLNGMAQEFGEHEAISLVRSLAAGDLSEEQLADWLRLRGGV